MAGKTEQQGWQSASRFHLNGMMLYNNAHWLYVQNHLQEVVPSSA